MESLLNFIVSSISYIGPFIVLMGTLIFIHEMGHFLVAKYFGVRVEVFSLGFGKTLYEFTRGETTYKLALIPLGGYVKMFGDDPSAELPEEEKKYSFLHKPVMQRIAIVLAGPIMNFLIAIPIFGLILVHGHKVPSSQIGDVKLMSPAHLIGFRSGDTITKINQTEIQSWIEVDKIISDSPLKDLDIHIKTTSGESKNFKVNIPRSKNDKLFGTSEYIGKIDGLSLASKSTLIGVKLGSLAHKSGLNSLDQIIKINEDPVEYWREIEPLLKKHRNSTTIITVQKFDQKVEQPERKITLKANYPINESTLLGSIGIEETSQYILGVVEDSPAQKAGLIGGDKIISLDGKPISGWEDILKHISAYKAADKQIEFVVENSDPQYGRSKSPKTLLLAPRMTEIMNRKMQDENRFTVGIYADSTYSAAKPIIIQSYNPVKVLSYGLSETLNWTKLIVVSLYKLATNQVSTRNITGIITIGKVAGDSFKTGFDYFLKIMGLISVNLFILNLLPIPVLDGGHLVFFTIEAIKGSPLSLKKMQAAQQVGFLLLVSLMIFSFYNDIKNLINPPF